MLDRQAEMQQRGEISNTFMAFCLLLVGKSEERRGIGSSKSSALMEAILM